jgi:hypothetical protein
VIRGACLCASAFRHSRWVGRWVGLATVADREGGSRARPFRIRRAPRCARGPGGRSPLTSPGADPRAKSEAVGGVIVLDAATGFAFLPYMNPAGELGETRVRDAVAFLAANDWLEVGTVNGRPSVALGQRARKLLEELLEEATAGVT